MKTVKYLGDSGVSILCNECGVTNNFNRNDSKSVHDATADILLSMKKKNRYGNNYLLFVEPGSDVDTTMSAQIASDIAADELSWKSPKQIEEAESE